MRITALSFLLLLLAAQRHAKHAIEDDHKLLMLAWIQEQIPVSSSSIVTADSINNAGGMLLLNDRYLLERPIQLPQLPSPQSTNTIETIGPLELSWYSKRWWSWSNNDEKSGPVTSLNDRYSLDNRLGQGGCGEVWFARDILDNGKQYVLKRIFASRQESGLREQYFGQLLRGEKSITRFIEAFYRTSSVSREIELWLVFEHEGVSLHSLLYETNNNLGVQQRSTFWKHMRETKSAGAHMRREICKQLVAALHVLAQRNIVHRDVKPANVLIQFEEHAIKLGDFGSAVDFESYFGNLAQPHVVLTRQDHSKPYEPPEFQHHEPLEVLAFAQFDSSFDAWSLGVLLLEVLLGTDRVFELSAEQQRVMARRRFNANVFDALKEFGLDDLERFNSSVQRLDDVYHRGFYDNEHDPVVCGNELDFVFQLLRLDPTKRMTMDAALKHPYLNMPHIPAKSRAATSSEFVCSSCKRKFSTYDGCKAHSEARSHGSSSSKTLQCAAATATLLFSLTEIRAQICEPRTLLALPNMASNASELWCGSRGKKRYSEDFFLASADRRVFVVADGHLGDAAARYVTTQLVQRTSSVGAIDVESLPNLFSQVNKNFLSKFPQDKSGAAATLVVLQDKQIIVANVGDVRALVCSRGGDVAPIVLTVDHMAATEKQRIEALPGGFVSFKNGRSRVQGILALSRSFGDREFRPFVIAEPHVRVFNLLTSSARFLVLASDGLIDAISDADICKIGYQELERGGSGSLEVMDHHQEEDDLPWYTRAATRLVYEAQMRDLTPDNVGVAVIPL